MKSYIEEFLIGIAITKAIFPIPCVLAEVQGMRVTF